MSKILIVEDEVAIADLEKDYLELSGFEVMLEYTGDAGLKRALEEDIDLLILDISFLIWTDLIYVKKSARKKISRLLWYLPRKKIFQR